MPYIAPRHPLGISFPSHTPRILPHERLHQCEQVRVIDDNLYQYDAEDEEMSNLHLSHSNCSNREDCLTGFELPKYPHFPRVHRKGRRFVTSSIHSGRISRNLKTSGRPIAQGNKMAHLESIMEGISLVKDHTSAAHDQFICKTKSPQTMNPKSDDEKSRALLKSRVSANISDGLVLIRLELPSLSGSAEIKGFIVIPSLAYEKEVTIRYTLDHWRTTTEISGKYDGVSEDIPDIGSVDRFHFTINIPWRENLSNTTFLLCARYSLGGEVLWETGSATHNRFKFSSIFLSVNETRASHGSRPKKTCHPQIASLSDCTCPDPVADWLVHTRESNRLDTPAISSNNPVATSNVMQKYLYPEDECCKQRGVGNNNLFNGEPKHAKKGQSKKSSPILSFEQGVYGDINKPYVRSAEYGNLVKQFYYYNLDGNMVFVM